MSSVRPSAGGWPSRRSSASKSSSRSTNMPGSGSKPSRTPRRSACASDALDALQQPLPGERRARGSTARRPTTSRRPARRARRRRRPRGDEHPHALAAALGEQRREVLAARVEREARAGLDDAREPELVEQRAQRRRARAHQRRVGVEVDVVERERDAVVAAVGEQPQRVLEPVADEPVGDVAVAQPRPAVEAASRHRPPAGQRAGERPQRRDAARRDERAGAGEQARLERHQAEHRRRRPRAAGARATGRARRRRARGRRRRRTRRRGRRRRACAAASRCGGRRARPRRRRRPRWRRARRAGAGCVAPWTSLRETVVVTPMCAPTTAADGSAARAPWAPLPISTSSVRQADIPLTAAGVSFSARSYAHTVMASGASTLSARGPSAATARPAAAAVSPPARPSAKPGVTRPDGIGRPGRSTASTSRSA